MSLLIALLLFSILPQNQGFCASVTTNYVSPIPTDNGDPITIAVNRAGPILVAAPWSGKILPFYPDGSPAGSINGFKKPLSVAADDSGRVYVGDLADGSVSVMYPAGQFLFKLGAGAAEFGMPGDIAVGPNGFIYVTDSPNHVAKVYSPEGTFQFSFGGSGTDPGQMIFPRESPVMR